MARQHRERLYSHSHILLFTSKMPVLGRIITLLHLVPAVLGGCSDAEQTAIEEIRREIGVTLTRSQDVKGPLDIFVFEDDRMQKLDCYLRLDDCSMWKGGVVSGSGDRILSFVAGMQRDRDDWTGITSRAALEKVTSDLEDERADAVLMTGETAVSGSPDLIPKTAAEVRLTPLASMISLTRLSCDFTGKPYSDKAVSNVRVYLTNVNATCGILATGDVSPTRIINQGRLSEEDMARFHDRSLVYHVAGRPVGKDTGWVPVNFLCYPNNAPEEGPGTPFTRMVIEGQIDGRTFYWPIDINREDGQGVRRGERYSFSITITGKGVSDPDIPVSSGNIEINFETKPWEEKEDCVITF